ncbi:MAG: hypothetical protein NTZ05_15080, partial [Chloroflexi bacterium]|nr:hypothetical protein [Chloroflexota bacterium]
MITLNPLSIVDSLAQGFAVVNRRPWLIAVPLALNLLLWLGPSVTAAPVIQGWSDTYTRLLQENPALAATQGRAVDELLDEARRAGEAAGQFNLLRVMALQAPALMTVSGSPSTTLEIHSGGALLALLVGLFLSGLYTISAYLTAIADQVRTTTASLELLPARVLRNWLRLLAYYGLLIGLAIPIMFGASLVLVLARLFGEGPASLVVSIAVGMALLVQVYLFFTHAAIFLADAGPMQAIRQSALVVSRFFWSGLGFMLLNWVIGTGFTVIFSHLFTYEPLGSAAAVLGHAYISTGLAAAAMVYF